MLKNMQKYTLNVQLDASGVRINSIEPDIDDLRSFVTVFRHFVMNNSQVYLLTIYKLCHDRLTSDDLKERVRASKQIWKEEFKTGGFTLNYNGREFSPEAIMDLWLNGHFFHDETEKMLLLRSLTKHESVLFRYEFLDFLIGATNQVFTVGNIVKHALREGLLKV